MKAPIIVNEHGDVMVFESKEDAEMYLEAVDVENGEYVAYDSEGRLLQLLPAPPHSASIKDTESDPSHGDELHTVLSDFLQRVNEPSDWVKQASLNQLVEKALEYKVDVAQRPLDGVRDFFKRLRSKLR